MLRIFFIFIFLCSFIKLTAQNNPPDSTLENYNIDSLKTIYGNHKELLKEYDSVSLIALSYYPELIDEDLKFKFASINSTARTTVTFGSVFKKFNKQYIIIINNDINRTGILLNQAPFDAQVALVRHELAHVLDFKDRSFLEMVWWGLSYLFVKQRTKIETLADQETIKHGLGWELYHWTNFVLHHSTANKKYLKMKESKYMLPDEILRYMKENGLQY